MKKFMTALALMGLASMAQAHTFTNDLDVPIVFTVVQGQRSENFILPRAGAAGSSAIVSWTDPKEGWEVIVPLNLTDPDTGELLNAALVGISPRVRNEVNFPTDDFQNSKSALWGCGRPELLTYHEKATKKQIEEKTAKYGAEAGRMEARRGKDVEIRVILFPKNPRGHFRIKTSKFNQGTWLCLAE